MPIVNHEMTKRYPELGLGPVPIESFVSPQAFELEREKIFKKAWLNVGRTDDIPKRGDYVVRELAVWKASIIVIRGQDEKVRAFHNVCPHRGNRVALEEKGTCKGFQCGFHGWVFDTKGSLIRVPGQKLFYDLDKSKLGLVELPCEIWNGFIFVNHDKQPKQSLEDFIGPGFYHRFDDFPFDELVLFQTHRIKLNCNYKVFLDAFQEGHHVAFLHSRSFPDALTSAEDPILHTEVELFDLHRMQAVTFNPGATISPMQALMAKHLGANYLRQSEVVPKGLNHTKNPHWLFDINVFFPNFRLLTYVDNYVYENYWPVSVNEMVWELRYYMRPPKTAAERIFSQQSTGALLDVMREDLSTLERNQKALESGAISEVMYSDEEILCRHMHKVIRDAVTAPDDHVAA
jgi:phenylpropionate dioxygenase-like ring-hydroxylating dioxygenase large terminal subunit